MGDGDFDAGCVMGFALGALGVLFLVWMSFHVVIR